MDEKTIRAILATLFLVIILLVAHDVRSATPYRQEPKVVNFIFDKGDITTHGKFDERKADKIIYRAIKELNEKTICQGRLVVKHQAIGSAIYVKIYYDCTAREASYDTKSDIL